MQFIAKNVICTDRAKDLICQIKLFDFAGGGRGQEGNY